MPRIQIPNQTIIIGLIIMGLVLVVGGIVLTLTHTDGPEWLGKTIAIIVGALITLAGGSQIVHREDS
jgi:hypothetical protein